MIVTLKSRSIIPFISVASGSGDSSALESRSSWLSTVTIELSEHSASRSKLFMPSMPQRMSADELASDSLGRAPEG
ncbi:hypothetical protein [Bradyrhizobium sp.]|jgi:hypothetical protein|uniref:hypothetical protein n=1 Tax=Bradyrhizobium sp. TaxID=376 RepID=UPI002DDC9E0F|nr:hypothetical protein [Bradyrhizobium sp.]HEV2153008.1 hypothetical protein [Bradyrhizobium sp.]